MDVLGDQDPLAEALTGAIRAGDLARLRELLGAHPHLARAGLADGNGVIRSPLHLVTDWPGHFAEGPATVRLLVEAGPTSTPGCGGPMRRRRCTGWRAATTWAGSTPSSTPGADPEADGAVIAGGTPLSDAVAFGQRHSARRLVERGARTPLREAAALGLADRVAAYFAAHPAPRGDDVDQAFWYTCHGGQLNVARSLAARARRDWLAPWDGLTPLDAARRSQGRRRRHLARRPGGPLRQTASVTNRQPR
jgi:uncharacterized protein